jgi:hypothetical protein
MSGLLKIGSAVLAIGLVVYFVQNSLTDQRNRADVQRAVDSIARPADHGTVGVRPPDPNARQRQ